MFKKIQIVSGRGTDKVIFQTNLPSGIHPFIGEAIMRLEVAAGQGEEYVKKNFPNIPYEILKV